MKVIITQLPRWNYFMWFLLGFYELQEKKEIKIRYKCNIIVNLASRFSSNFVSKALRKIYYKKYKVSNLYNMKGYIVLDNGEKKKFVIDSADAPFLFNSKDLEECDVYFKMQCPKKIEKEGFELAPEIIIPWTDHEKKSNGKARKLCTNFEKNKYKIKPLMIGTRKLANGISYKILKKGLDNYIESRNVRKNKKLMCYFGDAKGPVPMKVKKEELDVDEEVQLLGFYGDKIQHPNEKRAKAAQIISKLEPKKLYDARIINNGNSDTKNKNKNENLIIPIEKF